MGCQESLAFRQMQFLRCRGLHKVQDGVVEMKKKSKDYLKGFKAGAMWAFQWCDFQLRTGDFEAELEEIIYEMK